MNERRMLYDIIYALAAKDGREAVIFGDCAPLAREAFGRSLVGEAFPELWFEVPLLDDPWFDLHALASREALDPATPFDPETSGGFPEVFKWFASCGGSVRQLALSWDVSSGAIEHPAVQLLVSRHDVQTTCDFLTVAGRPDAVHAYRAFDERLPRGWFPCYSGVFPDRPGHNLRVECIPDHELQFAYADDGALLERHLRQLGLRDLGETLVPRCQALAKTPYHLEFQFDVLQDGTAGPTFSASVRFACPPSEGEWESFDVDGNAGELMRQVEEWGLADDRWRRIGEIMFAVSAARGGAKAILYCYPAFLKLRWRDGEPFDAKVYLIGGTQ